MENKVKILSWALALLVVLNLSIVGTIVYRSWSSSDNNEGITVEPNTPPINGRFFKQTLSFSNEQMAVYRSANKEFRQSANGILSKLEKLKEEMLTELQTSSPNQQKLDSIAGSIGELHAELKKSTTRFYISIKNICNDEQQKELENIFTPLFRLEKHQGPGRHQHRRR